MKNIKIGDLTLNLEELRGRQELLDYFNENGPTHSALMDFCEGYREKYGNELCWPYPISDGKHLGTFFVLVREGILSLPYDDADKENCELFCMDDAVLFEDYADMEIFMDDWQMFHEDLMQAMTGMRDYLRGEFRSLEVKEKPMNTYVVCIDSVWVHDSQMFDTKDLTEDELEDVNFYEDEDRWHDIEPTPFIAIVKAESGKDACEKAGAANRYDPRCLFAMRVDNLI